jgi:hypothetical protein
VDRIRTLSAVALLVAAGTVGAQSAAVDTVFGIGLGVPLSIPECERDHIGYKVRTASVCYQHPLGPKDPGPHVYIEFPISERPAMGTKHSALISDGIVDRLSFYTLGIKYQDSDLGQLTQRFGEPSFISRPSLQTAGGAKFEGINARWEKPGYVVTFKSYTKRYDEGLVELETERLIERRKKALELLRSKQRPL